MSRRPPPPPPRPIETLQYRHFGAGGGFSPLDQPTPWPVPNNVTAREKLQAIGTKWAVKQSAAILAVPSAGVPSEINYLLNPLHPEFRRIRTGRPQKVVTDPRLLKS